MPHDPKPHKYKTSPIARMIAEANTTLGELMARLKKGHKKTETYQLLDDLTFLLPITAEVLETMDKGKSPNTANLLWAVSPTNLPRLKHINEKLTTLKSKLADDPTRKEAFELIQLLIIIAKDMTTYISRASDGMKPFILLDIKQAIGRLNEQHLVDLFSLATNGEHVLSEQEIKQLIQGAQHHFLAYEEQLSSSEVAAPFLGESSLKNFPEIKYAKVTDTYSMIVKPAYKALRETMARTSGLSAKQQSSSPSESTSPTSPGISGDASPLSPLTSPSITPEETKPPIIPKKLEHDDAASLKKKLAELQSPKPEHAAHLTSKRP